MVVTHKDIEAAQVELLDEPQTNTSHFYDRDSEYSLGEEEEVKNNNDPDYVQRVSYLCLMLHICDVYMYYFICDSCKKKKVDLFLIVKNMKCECMW